MQRGFYCLVPMLAFSLILSAQPKAIEGRTEFQGKQVPAAVLELPYPPEIVETAVNDHFAKKGFKASKAKDFELYRSVPIGSAKTIFDVYVKTERKSRKEKESSVLYFVLARPNEMLSSRTSDDKPGINEGKEFLNDFTPYLETFNLNLEIIAQEEAIKKLEKKQTSLLSDSTDLYRKKTQLDEKISENSIAIQQQQAEIEKQRMALEAIRSRKKQ
jgi:hypothetical protein